MALDDASNFQQIKSLTEQRPSVPAHTLLAQPVCVQLVLIHMVLLDPQITPPIWNTSCSHDSLLLEKEFKALTSFNHSWNNALASGKPAKLAVKVGSSGSGGPTVRQVSQHGGSLMDALAAGWLWEQLGVGWLWQWAQQSS